MINLKKNFGPKIYSFIIYLLIFGMLESLFSSSILMFFEIKINNQTDHYFGLSINEKLEFFIFLIIVIISFLCSKYFRTYLIRKTYFINTNMELSLFQKLRFLNFNQFDSIGQDKIRTLLDDLKKLRDSPEYIINVVSSFILVFVCLFYLFYLNFQGALLLLTFIVGLIIFLKLRNRIVQKKSEELRNIQDINEQNINDFILGFREISINKIINDNIYRKHIKKNREKVRNLNIFINTKDLVNGLIGNYSFYTILAIILFVFPLLFDFNNGKTFQFILVIFFMITPVFNIVTSITVFILIKVSYDRVDNFYSIIERFNLKVFDNSLPDVFENEKFDSIKLNKVSFNYYDQNKSVIFKLNPIDIEIKRGECIFIIGGNGSGKSTFVNILSGLIFPVEGKIYFNKKELGENNFNSFSNKVTTIFSDPYLFSENYRGFDFSFEKLDKLIKKMKMEDILKFNEKKQIFDNSLSTGQKKRLALLYGLMERKEIIIMDEWAAEQDPIFKKYFYENLITDLIHEGKTILIITHDDNYFHCADRILKFEDGKIVSDSKFNDSTYKKYH